MPEPRWDPLGRRWVMLAPERARRGTRDPMSPEVDSEPCDFCGGNEQDTPKTTLALPANDNWKVRAFANKFPGADFHEVIVHGPAHDVNLETIDRAHRNYLMDAYRNRVRAATTTTIVAAFNRGQSAGASRSHEHSQILGFDLIPPVLARETEAFASEDCVACDLASGDFVVARHGAFATVANPAPFMAREMLIVGGCQPRFQDATDEELDSFGAALADALTRLQIVVAGYVPCNMVLHTAPRGVDQFHWHAHIYPRTSTFGFLEIGTELPLVGADPATDAAELREAK